ncbi:MAG TPA: GDSL-type esterase/lipase family protein [Dissulfurispiraceae bacterium]|nr:GDSL-type esterase/lipase family protein [Dissulfurispiraceae bacterium]
MKELVFIGDSLTEYFDWQSRFAEYHVYNLGVSGESVEELLERLPNTKLLFLPDYIFVMTGVNNLWRGCSSILPLYERILNGIKAEFAGAGIVVQSILPVAMRLDPNLILTINQSLRTMASMLSIYYLDVHSLFFGSDGELFRSYLDIDGVHLTSEGYAVWAAAVEKFLNTRYNGLRV